MEEATARAPGRIEVLGNHTDYNGGLVLACAIDLEVRAWARRLDRPVARLVSHPGGAPVEVPLESIVPLSGAAAWANYPLGVVQMLRSGGVKVPGFAARFASDLPVGVGLSSSAAIELVTGLLLLKLSGARMPMKDLALLCQRAENDFVGVKCGALDQFACAFGRRDHLVTLDFREESIRPLPFPPGFVFVVAHSGAARHLAAGAYNDRRESCQAAARKLGLPTLRDIDPAGLDRRAGELDPVILRRARHVVGENARVQKAARILLAGGAEELGPLLYESHESSRHNFENSTPELDLLVGLTRAIDGARGARLTGGGFGGATITLAQRDRAETVAAALAEQYRLRTGVACRTWICRAADGAG